MMMTTKKVLVILGVVAQLLFFEQESIAADASMVRQEIRLSVPIPEENSLTLVSVFRVVGKGDDIGTVAVYDDGSTERAGDYLELYNTTGELLALGWVDRFGIERGAVDRGLLRASPVLEGIFILFVDGDLI
jgi:hypothetical protein